MKIISFYTENTIYEKEVEDLLSSLTALEVDHYVEKRKDLGSWEANCAQKPLFIHECLERFNQPLLWVDADAIVLQRPNLELPPCDLALYFNDHKIKHVRSATIYIAPTVKAKQFVWLWHETLVKENQKAPTQDQPTLVSLVQEQFEKLKIEDLPIEYMHIFDRDEIPITKSVILHFQASRTAKMDPIFWKHLSGRELKAIRMKARA